MCSQVRINKKRILIFEKQLDRINRIVRIERPSAEGPLAASEKNIVNPVNPVYKIKTEFIPHPFEILRFAVQPGCQSSQFNHQKTVPVWRSFI